MLAAGCRQSSAPPQVSGGPAATTAARESGDRSDAPAAPTLVVASWQETQQRIAKSAGKVVVVDFWSTWCTPCVREFPQLVKLQEKFPDDVVCLSVNCNFTGAEGESPDDARDEIAAFLQQQRAFFTHVLCSDADLPLLEKLGAAAVPVVQVYDRQGTLRKQFTNDDGEYGEDGFEYARHIEPLVRELLDDAVRR